MAQSRSITALKAAGPTGVPCWQVPNIGRDLHDIRDLATLRTDAPVYDSLDDLRWEGPRPAFFELCARLNAPGLLKRAQALAP